MFTGIVAGTGKVKNITRFRKGARLEINPPLSFKSKKGDSVAVNGCCLTITSQGEIPLSPRTPHLVEHSLDRSLRRAKRSKSDLALTRSLFFEADLSHETLRRTNLGFLKPGDLVNLERSLQLSSRIGGHLVQGHVDGVGKILRIKKAGGGFEIWIEFPKTLRRYLIPKGSIAVDGISMTVHRLRNNRFSLVVIPHTLEATNLRDRNRGDWVNLEVDIVGKYIESFLQ